MANPTNVTFTPSTTIISSAWIQGVNDWVYGTYGVLGSTYTAGAFRTALGVPALAGGNTFTGTQAMGAVTATTLNGHTLTAGSSTFTGTAGQTYTFPTTSATLARSNSAQTFTGVQTFSTPIAITSGGTGTSAIPAFSAYPVGNQGWPAAAITQATNDGTEFNLGGYYNTANSTFTPLIAGYYQIIGSVSFSCTGAGYCSIFKNGTEFKRGAQVTSPTSVQVSALIYLNGSTDYIDLRAFNASGGAGNGTGATLSYFQGYLVRVA